MFQAIISPIFRSTRLCFTACSIMHPRCCRSVVWKRSSSASRLPAGIIPVHYTTSCNTQSAPEDGRNNLPEHVELIGIINKPLLLHLVGCLFYFFLSKNLFLWARARQLCEAAVYLPSACPPICLSPYLPVRLSASPPTLTCGTTRL